MWDGDNYKSGKYTAKIIRHGTGVIFEVYEHRWFGARLLDRTLITSATLREVEDRKQAIASEYQDAK